MRINFEDELLYWIACDTEARSRAGDSTVIPVQMLMTRMSLRGRDQSASMSQSTVLSLKAFDRATLVRTLNQLYSKQLIRLVDADGSDTESQPTTTNADGGGPQYVSITDLGLEHAEIIVRKYNL